VLYLGRQTFSELIELEVGTPAFDGKLGRLCVQLGAVGSSSDPAAQARRAA